jgi:hypothetical protein
LSLQSVGKYGSKHTELIIKVSNIEKKAMSEIVNLNVGGIQYSAARNTIMKHEETMLAKLVSEKWNPNSEVPIFVDRDGERFKYILDFFRDGEILVPNTVLLLMQLKMTLCISDYLRMQTSRRQ